MTRDGKPDTDEPLGSLPNQPGVAYDDDGYPLGPLDVFIVVDPVQDYEESLEIWGVYRSLDEAQVAAPGLRAIRYDKHENEDRDTEVQHWQRAVEVNVWTFTPANPGRSRSGWRNGR